MVKDENNNPKTEYQPKLKDVMICLRCGSKIGINSKKDEKDEYKMKLYYRCSNKKNICTSNTVPIKTIDKIIECKIEEFYKHIQAYGEVKDHIKSKVDIAQLYKQQIEITSTYPADEFIFKGDDTYEQDDIEEIAKQIYWAEYGETFREEFKFKNILKYSHIKLNIKDHYGIIKFMKPLNVVNNLTLYLNDFQIDMKDIPLPQLYIKFVWEKEKPGRAKSNKPNNK